MKPNFSGWVTRPNLKCGDGRTIKHGAFAHQDGTTVPVVYQHVHTDINQVLGHADLTERDGGTWGDIYLNPEVQSANTADALVKHGDIKKFSIWAKDLIEHGLDVVKGEIQEVSLVLAGKNPGANIENYNGVLAHSGFDAEDVLLIIGGEIVHDGLEDPPKEDPPKEDPPKEDPPKEDPPKEDPPKEGETVADVLDSLSEEQRTAVNSVIDDIVTEAVTEALTEEPVVQHSNLNTPQKGNKMSRNIWDRSTKTNPEGGGNNLPQLKHDDMAAVLAVAKGREGQGGESAVGSLRELVRSKHGQELMHAEDYGIQNIEVLFPDAQALMRTPTFVDRRQEWVKVFLAGTSHSPFSRVKTMHADITAEEARALGYIKGNQKTEEVFPVFKRTTGPAWIYKKQKLDREDIISITDFDVVAWMKVEMRGKLDEELARAALFGDGRPTMVGGELNPDKIQDPGGNNTSGNGIRAIVNDNDLYVGTFPIEIDAGATGEAWNALLDGVTEASEHYRGSGNKTGFISFRTATRLLTMRDTLSNRRIYKNLSEVAGDMDCSTLVRVPTELMPTDVLAVVLDLSDYNFGTDKGGELTLFDDFDIDFNQYKYLMEVFLSGALTLPFSAQVFKRVDVSSTLVHPAKLGFTTPATIEYVAQTGVVYKRTDTGATLAADVVLAEDQIVTIEATPASGYHFESNLDDIDTEIYEYGDDTVGPH